MLLGFSITEIQGKVLKMVKKDPLPAKPIPEQLSRLCQKNMAPDLVGGSDNIGRIISHIKGNRPWACPGHLQPRLPSASLISLCIRMQSPVCPFRSESPFSLLCPICLLRNSWLQNPSQLPPGHAPGLSCCLVGRYF